MLVEMKKDMGGAAAVLGAMLAISELKPKTPVLAVVPLTFNMIDAKATLPGDVVKSYSGKTVEIRNTDAEGRLILSDALHYAVEQKAGLIVDVATLTGACVVALGAHFSGCFSNNPDLQDQALEMAARCGDPAWPLPLARRYSEEMKSEIADLSNMGSSRDGGASLAAAFMENFVGDTSWIHFDIAGTVDLGTPGRTGAKTFAAGRMVHTLMSMAIEYGED
jgi:leucyl aminopeptidase